MTPAQPVPTPSRPAFTVRPMRPQDIPGVVSLAANEPTAPHWPVAEYRRMLTVIADSPARRGAWVLLAPHPDRPLLKPSHRRNTRSLEPLSPVIGFAMASQVAGICDLEAVVVESLWRGQRLGAKLVTAAAAWGQTLAAARLQLEVRASNAPALALYRRLGFEVDGTRPGYYRNPEEEAVLMSLDLTK